MGLAVGSFAAGLARKLTAGTRTNFETKGEAGARPILLFDCRTACTIKESLAGYQCALEACAIRYRLISDLPNPNRPARTLIVPAAHWTDRRKVRLFKESLNCGGTLLLESGATFLEADKFECHRRLMESELGIMLGTPRRLWEGGESEWRAPYLQYTWPAAVKIRDFSRMVRVGNAGGESIAHFEGMSVATRKQIGCGTLVYLGSPLGPHLLAGDREAQFWLRRFCSIC